MTALRRTLILSLLALIPCLTGCFDIEEVIKLNQDLSGEATVRLKVDMNGMVAVMAQLKKQMKGEEGEVTPEELEAARKDFKEQNKDKEGIDKEEMEADKQKLIESLPEGVTLKTMEANEGDMSMEVVMTFAFDDVAKLAQIEMPAKEGEEEGPGPKNPIKKPFEGLVVEKTDDSLTLRIEKPLDPTKKEEEAGEGEEGAQGGAPPGLDKIVEGVMSKSLKVGYRFETPFEVVDSNATDVKDGALEWNYTLETLKKLKDEGGEADPPHATYKR